MFDIVPARDRKVVRRAVTTRCEAVADRGFRLLGRTLRDLSPEGAFLEIDAGTEVELGEEVYVSFQAPRTRAWIDARARVVRCVAGRRSGDRARGIGLRFEAIDSVDRALLEGTLCRLPPPVPARHPRADYASAILAIAGS